MDLSKSLTAWTRKVSNSSSLGTCYSGVKANCVPPDGELCLCRVKPEETLVEARSGSDVQIDRQTWAWGRK
jgi:hypothetical protein